jgi:hypothetical protein
MIILSTLKCQSDSLRQFVQTSNIEEISLSHENSNLFMRSFELKSAIDGLNSGSRSTREFRSSSDSHGGYSAVHRNSSII